MRLARWPFVNDSTRSPGAPEARPAREVQRANDGLFECQSQRRRVDHPKAELALVWALSEATRQGGDARPTPTFGASLRLAPVQPDVRPELLPQRHGSRLLARDRVRAHGPACGTSRTRPLLRCESRSKVGGRRREGIGRVAQFRSWSYRSWRVIASCPAARALFHRRGRPPGRGRVGRASRRCA
jgi:hypothetical protein